MSTVFLQIGQCGNQVGRELYKTISKFPDQRPIFASQDEKWRSIHVDSETKVVNNLYHVNKKRLRKCNIVSGKYARGTAWAMGDHGLGGETLLSCTLEALRREVERCDSYCGTVMIHSLSGLTGSGLGSRLCERLKDEYPLAFILSAVVAPHASGESPLQHYNSVLSLAWLQRFSDAIVLFQNDEILRRLTGVNVSKRTRDGQQISLADMNSYIADCLAGTFLPLGKDTKKMGKSNGICTGNEPWEMVQSVCPMPSYKHVHTSCFHRSKSSWESIAGSLVTALDRYDKHGNPFVSLANLAVVRGDSGHAFPKSVKAVENKLKSGYNCVTWNPFPVDFWIGEENLIGSKEGSSLTVCANSSSIVQFGQTVLAKAKAQYDAKAYLHWYQRWGYDQSCFVESFETLEGVIQDYTTASSTTV